MYEFLPISMYVYCLCTYNYGGKKVLDPQKL